MFKITVDVIMDTDDKDKAEELISKALAEVATSIEVTDTEEIDVDGEAVGEDDEDAELDDDNDVAEEEK